MSFDRRVPVSHSELILEVPLLSEAGKQRTSVANEMLRSFWFWVGFNDVRGHTQSTLKEAWNGGSGGQRKKAMFPTMDIRPPIRLCFPFRLRLRPRR